MATRRMSSTQVAKLVEGAEMIGEATGLSVAEVVSLVLSEPEGEEPKEAERKQAIADNSFLPNR